VLPAADVHIFGVDLASYLYGDRFRLGIC